MKTLMIREWNPNTNPPFYTIKFDREIFIDPLKHVEYAAHKSHEYVPDKFKYGKIEERGFIVGTHRSNISTTFDHPYSGPVCSNLLQDFGLEKVLPLNIRNSVKAQLFHKLPYRPKRKFRYWAEKSKVVSSFYNWIRS